MNTIQDVWYSTTLTGMACGVCGIPFGMSESFYKACQQDHSRWFYCPNGHHIHFLGKTEAQKERERRMRAEATESALRDQLLAAERSARSYKGQVTKIRNRIAQGICPVPGCRRSGFARVKAHIAAKHPTWVAEHVHEMES